VERTKEARQKSIAADEKRVTTSRVGGTKNG